MARVTPAGSSALHAAPSRWSGARQAALEGLGCVDDLERRCVAPARAGHDVEGDRLAAHGDERRQVREAGNAARVRSALASQRRLARGLEETPHLGRGDRRERQRLGLDREALRERLVRGGPVAAEAARDTHLHPRERGAVTEPQRPRIVAVEALSGALALTVQSHGRRLEDRAGARAVAVRERVAAREQLRVGDAHRRRERGGARGEEERQRRECRATVPLSHRSSPGRSRRAGSRRRGR
ncbi:MAG: hypothetical protein IPK07_07310 [Deltaproteobacteria bacterium]|nr:hypothetical protein [Deltaproteobacteria bacterium]